jgi:hypothetical protein
MRDAGQIISRYMVNPLDPQEGYVEIITDECWGATHVKLKEEA